MHVCVYVCVYVCMYVCMYVCICARMVAVWYSGCVLGSGPEVLSSSPTQATFRLVFHLPPTSPPSCDWHLLGCKFKAFSHATAMVQVGLRVPTPLAVMKGLFSCGFLAQL